MNAEISRNTQIIGRLDEISQLILGINLLHKSSLLRLLSWFRLRLVMWAQLVDNITGMSEVEETLNRMQTHKNVQGIVIVNGEGAVIRSTYTNERKEEGNALARLIPQLIAKAKNTVRDLDPHNQLKFMRLKTTKYEILIAPDNEFILIVVQGQKSEGKEEEES